jgi:hypothetical protein
MLNFLLVIVVAIVIGFLNFKYDLIGNANFNRPAQKMEVNNVVNDAINTADEARRLQKEQLDNINN